MSDSSDNAPYKYAKTLAFRPVDPAADCAALIAFGRDLYIESLGDDAGFRRDFGQRGERFPAWIESCADIDPAFAAFLTEDESPIGLVALGANGRGRRVGHVHHFYVVPSHRGQGFGGLLDDYARETLRAAGFVRARLNVAPKNARALRFYEAQGWRVVPRQRGAYGLRNFEISL